MPFRIINADNGLFVRSLLTELPYEFETGNEAQRFAKQLSADTDEKYRVKKVLNAEWRKREQRKFDDGTYDLLPWYHEDWWQDPNSVDIWKYQFPHPSRKQPGMIAYVESEEKGMDNIVTRVKPGRYLEQFRDVLKMYRMDLQRTAARFTVLYDPRKLHIAETEDDIQWVYENGPPSCMSTKEYRAEHSWGYGGKGKWPLNIHACRVYAGPDLKVAYIVADDDAPKTKKSVLARAVIWPALKSHSRVYGEELALTKVLQREGYSFGPPIGAKLQRHVVDKVHFVCPYIDGGHTSGQGALAVVDKQEYLEIVPFRTPLSHCANSTSGSTGARIGPDGREAVPRTCQRCGHGEVLDGIQVFTSGTDYQWWCAPCRDDGRTERCAFDGRVYSVEYMDFVEMFNGARWSRRAFNSRGFTCQGTEKRYPREHMVRLNDGTLWSNDYAMTHAVRCGYNGFYVRKEEAVEIYDRQHRPMIFSKEAADLYCFTCSVCQERNWDGNKFKGGKEQSGPFVCATCERKKNPAGQATVEALAGNGSVMMVHPFDATPMSKRMYCVLNGQVIKLETYRHITGSTPRNIYSADMLSYILSPAMWQRFLENGVSGPIAISIEEGRYILPSAAELETMMGGITGTSGEGVTASEAMERYNHTDVQGAIMQQAQQYVSPFTRYAVQAPVQAQDVYWSEPVNANWPEPNNLQQVPPAPQDLPPVAAPPPSSAALEALREDYLRFTLARRR